MIIKLILGAILLALLVAATGGWNPPCHAYEDGTCAEPVRPAFPLSQ